MIRVPLKYHGSTLKKIWVVIMTAKKGCTTSPPLAGNEQ